MSLPPCAVPHMEGFCLQKYALSIEKWCGLQPGFAVAVRPNHLKVLLHLMEYALTAVSRPCGRIIEQNIQVMTLFRVRDIVP